MPATDTNRDRCPKILGSARAYMLLRKHLRLDYMIGGDGKPCAPMIHQADGLAAMLERLERFDTFGLLHDMGCGKTLTMIGLLLAMHEEGSAETMFVACPSSVVGAWQRECENLNARAAAQQQASGEPIRPVIECLGLSQAGVPKREAALQRCIMERDARRAGGERLPPLVVATNYEGTWRMENVLRVARFDIIACDESQRIKAPGSKQSLAMYRIGKTAKFRVIMTGTPVPEGGLDWYGQWRFGDPAMLGTNYANFKARFALEFEIMGGNGKTFRKVQLNPHTADQLEAIVMERVHRVSKEEAVDLPEQTSAIIEFELSSRQRKIYDALVADSIALIEQRGIPQEYEATYSEWDSPDHSPMYGEVVGDNVLTRMLRLQQITGGYMQIEGDEGVVPCDPKSNPKLSALGDLAETLRDAGAPLVIFHRFTHEGLAIERLCKRLSGKDPVSVINGSVPAADRKLMVEQFQAGDAMFFVGQIQACAEGITLHAAADSALYSMPFSAAVYQQALARIHRIGQTRPVTHHHLLALNTIDESVYDTQQRKLDASVDAVDGGWARFFRGGR
jgi:SNF2 family DNA or RNA helicase